MQARGVKDIAVRRLEAIGLTRVHAYQPQHLFAKNGRKLALVAEPTDPWLVFASDGERSYSAVAASPKLAAGVIVVQATMPALARLDTEIGKLTEALRGERSRP